MNTLTKIAAAALLMLGLGATPSEAGPFSSFRAMISGAPSVTAVVSISEQRMTLKVVDKQGTAQT